ncbi:hypothetical protein [Nonomuraea guangzhouensis]|uniref:Uncharacterized protein n=1 Tax=Nonomuraea guangzhouensis TaxID=1291555 RepID=A0ABW4GW74_9ACTN|nr:hypothetical protein [Nonomuraea guangzhouensis]
MADHLPQSPAKPTARRGYAFVIAVAGALLVFCAFLPWTGVEARIGAIGGVSDDMRGIDDSLGVYTLVAGLVTLVFGVAGLFARPLVAALAVVPGVLATVWLLMFVVDPPGVGNGVSVDLGFLSIEPGIRYGWFAALACALAVIALAVLSLVRGRRA